LDIRNYLQEKKTEMSATIPSFYPYAKFDESTRPHTLLNPELFERDRLLGEGGFGAVYKVIDPTGAEYALKILTEPDPEILADEVKSMYVLSRFPSCVPELACYIDAFTFVDDDGIKKYGIVTSYIDGMDLHSCAMSHGGTFTPEEAMWILGWLVRVVDNLHRLGFVHRDIKPQNIMIDTDGNLHLIDFGISCTTDPSMSPIVRCRGDSAGTIVFLSPEILEGSYRMDIEKYYQTSDIYAAGVTIYNLLTGQYPYDLEKVGPRGFDYAVDTRYHAIETGYPCLDRLIEDMLIIDPDQRITAPEILNRIETCSRDVAAVLPSCGLANVTPKEHLGTTKTSPKSMGSRMPSTIHGRRPESRYHGGDENVPMTLPASIAQLDPDLLDSMDLILKELGLYQ